MQPVSSEQSEFTVKVIKVHNKRITVDGSRPDACKGCHGGCGLIFGSQTGKFTLRNPADLKVKPGDQLLIRVRGSQTVTAATFLFAAPAVLTVAAAVTAEDFYALIAPPLSYDTFSAIWLLSVPLLSLAILAIISRIKHQLFDSLEPEILKKLDAGEVPNPDKSCLQK